MSKSRKAQRLLQICEREFFPERLTVRSEKTRYQYRLALRDFSRHLGRAATIADLTDRSLTVWMGELLDQQPPISVNTIRERVGRVQTLWTWLARKWVVRRFPTVLKPQAPDPLPLALTEDQLRRLFRSARKERGHVAGIPADLWWVSFLGFVWCTTERKSAALSVHVDWIDFERCTVTIPPQMRKGGRKWGVYELWPQLIPLLRSCIMATPPRSLMWPWPKCEGAYYTAYNRILRDAQIPVTRQTKTHGLRVSHATWLKVLGGDPTRKLMHGDQATTNRHYIDPRHLPSEQPRLFIPWA